MLDDKTYAEPARQSAFVTRLMNRLDTLPAVEMAGATNSLPLWFNMLLSVTMSIEGHPELGENADVDFRSVTPYFLQQKQMVPSDPKPSLNPTPACTAQSFAAR